MRRTFFFKTAWKGQIHYPSAGLSAQEPEEVAVVESEIKGYQSYHMSVKEANLQREFYDDARMKGRAGNILALYGSAPYIAGPGRPNEPVRDEQQLDEELRRAEDQTLREANLGDKRKRKILPGYEMSPDLLQQSRIILRYVLVVEHCAGGDLRDQIGHESIKDYTNLDPRFARRTHELEVGVVMKQFLNGLKVLHDMNYAHRDIKAVNALLKKKFGRQKFHNCASGGNQQRETIDAAAACLPADTVKVMDFGLAIGHADAKKMSCKATEVVMAGEPIRRPPGTCWGARGTSTMMKARLYVSAIRPRNTGW